MKFNYIGILFIGFMLAFTSCKSDDDSNDLLPQEEQNQVDDAAIQLFLQQHYFNAVGKVVKFSDTNSNDDNETPLSEIAVQGSNGYWYAKKPGYMAEGRAVNDPNNDSILLQYEIKSFYGRKTNDSIYYTEPSNFSSTINTTGLPVWDPAFYHYEETETQRSEWYEMEGIQEGLKHFNSTGRNATDLPAVDFQGLIIVPSRLVFERDQNGFGFSSDASVFLNFELYQVIDRD